MLNSNMSIRKPCAVEKDELPPGWTVKIRVRRNKVGGRKRKIDKHYVDPETGHIFNSMKQVVHYLQTGEITNNKSRKTHLLNMKLGVTPSVPIQDVNKGVYGINTRKSALQCQVNNHRYSKLHSEGEGSGDPDREANKNIIKGTVKRVRTFTEDTQHDERKEDDSPGNTSAIPPTQAKVPETSTSMNESRITDNGNDNHSDEKEGAFQEQLDELKEKKMNNQTHEVSVLKLSKGNVELNKSLKGMHGSEVHIREEQIRDVLKKLRGPVLLPAGYIPLPPYHHIGTSGSKFNGNVVEPLDTPPTRAMPITGGDTSAGGCAPNNILPSNSAPPNGDVWGDPCFDFAVRILASEYKLAADPPGILSSFQHGFNSSKAQ